MYCVLILFGADFIGQPMGINAILALVHLVGVTLGFWGLWIGLRGFFSRVDRVTQVLVAGTIIVLAAGAFGPYMIPVTGAHEIVTVLPFCAVLAWLLGGRLVKARLEPVLALGLVLYLGGLAHNDTQPVQAPWHQDLADWLVAHHLIYGLAGYWESNITTLDSGGKVRLAPLTAGGASAYPYESDYSWYNPAVSQANFIVSVTWPPADVCDRQAERDTRQVRPARPHLPLQGIHNHGLRLQPAHPADHTGPGRVQDSAIARFGE